MTTATAQTTKPTAADVAAEAAERLLRIDELIRALRSELSEAHAVLGKEMWRYADELMALPMAEADGLYATREALVGADRALLDAADRSLSVVAGITEDIRSHVRRRAAR